MILVVYKEKNYMNYQLQKNIKKYILIYKKSAPSKNSYEIEKKSIRLTDPE